MGKSAVKKGAVAIKGAKGAAAEKNSTGIKAPAENIKHTKGKNIKGAAALPKSLAAKPAASAAEAVFLYESLFWIGFALVIFSYVSANEYYLMAGLVLSLVSLLIYETCHRPEKRAKYYFYLFYLAVILVVGYVIYTFLEKIRYILTLPVRNSWLLYVIFALIILDFLIFVMRQLRAKPAKPIKQLESSKIFHQSLIGGMEGKILKNAKHFWDTKNHKVIFRVFGTPRKPAGSWFSLEKKEKKPEKHVLPLFKQIHPTAEKRIRAEPHNPIKSIFGFFRKKKEAKKPGLKPAEPKTAEPKIRIIKADIKAKAAEKREMPLQKKPTGFKKFSRLLTYTFAVVILSFALYRGLIYLSPSFSDRLLFYTMLAMMFFTLAVFIAHLIVTRRAGAAPPSPELKIAEAQTKMKKSSEQKLSEQKTGAAEGARYLAASDRVHKTDIDLLYEIVNTKGRAKMSFLAKAFNVDRKTIEDWAALLEEHELLKIHYPAIGEAELMIPKEAQKEERHADEKKDKKEH